jgi:hypothetical protein
VTLFFAFPAEIRKVIYTTNAVESLNSSLRKIIETRGSFPHEEAPLRLLYLALRNYSKKWRDRNQPELTRCRPPPGLGPEAALGLRPRIALLRPGSEQLITIQPKLFF